MYAQNQLVKRSRTASSFNQGVRGTVILTKQLISAAPEWPPQPSRLNRQITAIPVVPAIHFWFPEAKMEWQRTFGRTRRCFPGFSTPEHPNHAGLITHHARLTATTGT
ncbi:hypothetical protein ASPBRDRAFT_27635 [Aspergillus brasiliensis CBS 101740]|uniref:Uncharacterized protein n=1 Tax=Aspergillus brasiliensis (strain CBS 101740 / IMI 381727 / IBT 21946) TaxID=767769 RepID=A0A1L9USV8_ASPBC|nr:hypothetical protein ASPBRDRAFT_27635 [Aspergillus brasiliensis CBS 101740]